MSTVSDDLPSHLGKRPAEDSIGPEAKKARGMHTTSPQFLAHLIHSKVEAPRTDTGVIFFCLRTDKVKDVWEGLIKHNFLSVPVLLKSKSKYYGFVDLADIVSYVVRKFPHSHEHSAEHFWDVTFASQEFNEITINDIMQYPLTRRNPFKPVTEGYSLFSALELLAREPHLHRVPVITAGEDRRLVNIITQSQLLKMLQQQKAALGSVLDKPVTSLPSYARPVVTCHASDLAVDCFHRLVDEHISGMAIVDKEGRVIGNLSARDLKGLNPTGRVFWRLFLNTYTVDVFLQKVKDQYEELHGRPHEVVVLTEDDTVGTAIDKLVNNHVHRLFIVDQDQRPVGVVSLRDILLEIINN